MIDPKSVLASRAANGDGFLHVYSRKGEIRIVNLLLRFCTYADVNLLGSGNMTPLHLGAFGKSYSVCRSLMQARADPGVVDCMHRLPENWASVQQAHDLAQFLRRARKGK
jgi:hypothetical protein